MRSVRHRKARAEAVDAPLDFRPDGGARTELIEGFDRPPPAAIVSARGDACKNAGHGPAFSHDGFS